jgi:hypothetical protein
MNIVVRELVGENAVTLEDGDKIYQTIFPALKSEEKISIDFTGVKVFASPFFNAAIGKLLKDFIPDALNRLISFLNLNPVGSDVLKRVIENSKQFYGNPEIQKAVERTISQKSEEH